MSENVIIFRPESSFPIAKRDRMREEKATLTAQITLLREQLSESKSMLRKRLKSLPDSSAKGA